MASPPKPQLPTAAIEAKEPSDEASKKPDWLAELSRKQANRRSGLFTNSSDASLDANKSAGTSPPKIAENNNKPVIATDKPHIPLKPSQIRDEGSYFFILKNSSRTEKYISANSWLPLKPSLRSGFKSRPYDPRKYFFSYEI